jgi:hypothetical protein
MIRRSDRAVYVENFIAFDLDRLFRSERRTNADVDYPRAEAARILLQSSRHAAGGSSLPGSACHRRPEWRSPMPSVASTKSPRGQRRILHVRAGASPSSPLRPGRGRYSGLPPPGSPRMPVGAFATVRPRLTRCGTGEGRFGAPDDRFDPLSLLVAHPLPKTNQDRVVRAEN